MAVHCQEQWALWLVIFNYTFAQFPRCILMSCLSYNYHNAYWKFHQFLYLTLQTATFIVHRILLNKDVFSHCDQAGRFLDILRRLELMINELAKGGSFAEDTRKQLLQQIILCYHRLLENPGLLNANTVALHIFICNFIFCIYMLCEIEWQCIC